MNKRTGSHYLLSTRLTLDLRTCCKWKDGKRFHADSKQKRVKVAILISDKTDFMSKIVTKDKKGHYIMIKGLIHQEDVTIINIYVPNIRTPKYVQQTLTVCEEEGDSFTIKAGDFSIPLSTL